GFSTTLATLSSPDYITGKWVYVSIQAAGSAVKVQVYRLDTGQYLNRSRQWQSTAAWALEGTDTSLARGRQGGLANPSPYAGTVYFDNFNVVDLQAPTVSFTSPTSTSTITSITTFQVSAQDPSGIARVDFYVDNVLRSSDTTAPYTFTLDPTRFTVGYHSLLV